MNVYTVDHSRRYSGEEHWTDVSEDIAIFSTVDAAQAHVEATQPNDGLDDGTWKWAPTNRPKVWYYKFTWDDDELNELERDRLSAWIIMEVEVKS